MFYWVIFACGGILVLASFVAVYRIVVGPSLFDRIIAFDVLISIFMAAVILEMSYSKSLEHVMLLVILAFVGFIGSVSVARFTKVEE